MKKIVLLLSVLIFWGSCQTSPLIPAQNSQNSFAPFKIKKIVEHNVIIQFAELLDGTKMFAKNFISNIHPARTLKITETELFKKAFVNVLDTPVELYNSDGSVGAALGAGIGAAVFSKVSDAFLSSSQRYILASSLNGAGKTTEKTVNVSVGSMPVILTTTSTVPYRNFQVSSV